MSVATLEAYSFNEGYENATTKQLLSMPAMRDEILWELLDAV